jgi:hypothetical protein
MVQLEKLALLEQEFIKLYENDIVLDGITDIDNYINSEEKILWILKEPDGGGFDLRDFHKDLCKYNLWRKTYKLVIKVSYAIHSKIYDYKNIPNEFDIMGIMNKIAFINIKKSGGGSRSYYKIINDYFNRDKELLLEQIKCLEPTTIINCSGVYGLSEILKTADINKNNTDNIFSAALFDNGIIINAQHPNCRYNHNSYFNNVIDYVKIYQEIKKNNKR